MPRTSSARKALRQTVRRTAHNTARQALMQKTVKQLKKLVIAGKIDEAKAYLPIVYKTLDKLAKVDFIKSGKADRLKSRLTKSVEKKKISR